MYMYSHDFKHISELFYGYTVNLNNLVLSHPIWFHLTRPIQLLPSRLDGCRWWHSQATQSRHPPGAAPQLQIWASWEVPRNVIRAAKVTINFQFLNSVKKYPSPLSSAKDNRSTEVHTQFPDLCQLQTTSKEEPEISVL